MSILTKCDNGLFAVCIFSSTDYLVREPMDEMWMKFFFLVGYFLTRKVVYCPSRTGYIIHEVQSKIKMCGPLLKIKSFNFKMATSEHLIKCGALLSTRPCVTRGTCLTHIEGSWSWDHVQGSSCP